jgi:hypothetical protein
MASANLAGRNLPPPQSPFVDKSTLNLSYDGYQFLLDLLNAATSALTQQTVAKALASTGANQATALQLTSQWSVFKAVPAGSGALLSVLQPGQMQVVFNQAVGLGTVSLYPPPGMQIDSNPINFPYLLTAAKMQIFWTLSATQIYSTQLQIP